MMHINDTGNSRERPKADDPSSALRLVECPRDAMQGWKHIIPTEKKIDYLNSLLQVGFDTIDFGSFVSSRAIPQMADTKEVIGSLEWEESKTKLLAIVANLRGAEEAMPYDAIAYLGFPFSVSETFQQRNANCSIATALERAAAIQDLCLAHHKQLVVYISMGFGNPYGDPYAEDKVCQWVHKLAALGIGIISLADTVGLATAPQVFSLVSKLVTQLPAHEIGVHLHAAPDNWLTKLEAAREAGCRRFDGALKGIGGCPMAGNELVGNIDTLNMLDYFTSVGAPPRLNRAALEKSLRLAAELFV